METKVVAFLRCCHARQWQTVVCWQYGLHAGRGGDRCRRVRPAPLRVGVVVGVRSGLPRYVCLTRLSMWMQMVGRTKASGVATIVIKRTVRAMRIIDGTMMVVVDPSGTTSGVAIVSACRKLIRNECSVVRRLLCAAGATGGGAVCDSRRLELWKRPLRRRHRPAKQIHAMRVPTAAIVTATWLLRAPVAALLCAVVASSPASSVLTVAATIAPPSALASSSQLRPPSPSPAAAGLGVVVSMTT